MGVLDDISITIHCPKCNLTEKLTCTQYGSSFSSYWGKFTKSISFKVVVTRTGDQEPTITAATCKQCGGPAKVG
jgi:hypothetical protein